MSSKIAKYCNCTKRDECPSPGPDYECCSEAVPNGSPSRFGLWMKEKNCDRSKGLPKDAHLDNKEGFKHMHHPPHPQGVAVESYNDDMYPMESPKKMSSVRSCANSQAQPYSAQPYSSQGYMKRAGQGYPQQGYPQKAYSQQGYPQKSNSRYNYYEDEDDEEEEEEEEDDPCQDLRTGFNMLLLIVVIGVLISGVYYLKSKKPKEK